MKYMGSKSKIAKHFLPIITKNINERDYYIEPFVGGCNVIDKISGIKRIASDNNKYLISMWRAIQNDWTPPKNISKEEYQHIKNNKNDYPDYFVGYVGFALSFRGKWFGGFIGNTKRDYQKESFNHYLKQKDKIKDVKFILSDYKDLNYPENSIIYLDPPYKNTTKYFCDFNHDEFWNFARRLSEANDVYISETDAPDDFNCLWKMSRPNHLGNKKGDYKKYVVEKLYKISTKVPL